GVKRERGGCPDPGAPAEVWDQPADLLQLAIEVRRGEREGADAVAGVRAREREAQADVRGARPRECGDQRRAVPKVVTPSAKRQAVAIMTDAPHELSVQRACRAVRLSRAAYYRPPADRVTRDQAVIDALNGVVAKRT